MSAGGHTSASMDASPGAAAVTELVEREAPHLLEYFARRVATHEDAADLLGDTLVVLWRKERAVPRDPIEARMWMFGIARRVLSQHRRGARRKHNLSARLALELRRVAIHAADDGHVEVREALQTLRRSDQEIIRLVYWDGFTLAEAAQLLGMKAATVRSRHARARAALQTHLLASTGVT